MEYREEWGKLILSTLELKQEKEILKLELREAQKTIDGLTDLIGLNRMVVATSH